MTTMKNARKRVRFDAPVKTYKRNSWGGGYHHFKPTVKKRPLEEFIELLRAEAEGLDNPTVTTEYLSFTLNGRRPETPKEAAASAKRKATKVADAQRVADRAQQRADAARAALDALSA